MKFCSKSSFQICQQRVNFQNFPARWHFAGNTFCKEQLVGCSLVWSCFKEKLNFCLLCYHNSKREAGDLWNAVDRSVWTSVRPTLTSYSVRAISPWPFHRLSPYCAQSKIMMSSCVACDNLFILLKQNFAEISEISFQSFHFFLRFFLLNVHIF